MSKPKYKKHNENKNKNNKIINSDNTKYKTQRRYNKKSKSEIHRSASDLEFY